MPGLLQDKVAVVTGGASGIGEATVCRFVAEGASVMVADLDVDGARRVAELLGPLAGWVECDVTDEASIEAAVSQAVDRFGRLDIMFNNAAGVGSRAGVKDLDGGDFDAVMALVARSVLLGHKHAARQFERQGTGGAIVSTASTASLEGGWSATGYTIAKHAVVGIIRQAALELAPLGIRSNAVAPGVIMTSIQARSYGIAAARHAAYRDYLNDTIGVRHPMGRFGEPDDVAKVATFLASDLAAYVNGVVIPVDGGSTAFVPDSYVSEFPAATKRFLEMA